MRAFTKTYVPHIYSICFSSNFETQMHKPCYCAYALSLQRADARINACLARMHAVLKECVCMVAEDHDAIARQHRLLLVLLLATRYAVLSVLGTPDAKAKALSYRQAVEKLVSLDSDAPRASWNQMPAAIGLILHVTGLQGEGMGDEAVTSGDGRFGKMLPAARGAFRLCQCDSSEAARHYQLVCVALRCVGELMIIDGCAAAVSSSLQFVVHYSAIDSAYVMCSKG
jgi:hypothetical protein